MKDLRNLLLDARSALRRADPNFAKHPLRERLDESLRELDKNGGDGEGQEELAEPETFSAQQVAYAWQIATRQLRLTHPDLHAKLVTRVHDMLDADVLHDPAVEIMELQSELENKDVAHQTDAAELQALRLALANAVPLHGRDAIGSDRDCAYRRIQRLVDAAAKGGHKAEPIVDDPNDLAHTREELQAVALGQRQLSRWERAWCLAEALVMTDFTAAQLQKQGDAALAKLVLAGPALPPA